MIALLHKPAAPFHYHTMALLFSINKLIPEALSFPLMTTTHTFYCTHPVGHQVLVMVQLPNHPHHRKYQAFQYVQLWKEMNSATAYHDPLLLDDVLADVCAQMLGPFHNHWPAVLQANDPSKPLCSLVQQFFSLLHLLRPKLAIQLALVPNCIQAGNCLAHYLQQNLQAPQLMPPGDYHQLFQLALSTLNHLKHLWEPTITTTEACTIFLHSFPHYMVHMFRNLLDTSFTPLDLTLDNITNGMENILTVKLHK